MNGNLQRLDRSAGREQLPRRVAGIALIAFGLWVLGQSIGRFLLIAAVLAVIAALVLVLVWRRSLPHRATMALTLLARGRDGERPRLRRLWRKRAVWHLAWRVPLGVTVTSLLRQREAIEQALDVSIELWYDRRLVHMRAGTARLPKHVDFLDFYRRPPTSGELTFGVGRGREGALWVDLVQLPHLLIGGATGEGKTAFLRQLITGLVLRSPVEWLRLAMVDLKGMEFGLFEQLPHMWGPVARELDSALALLQELGAELDRRQAAFAQAGVQTLTGWNVARPAEALAYVLVVVDECAELSAAEVSDREERARKQAALAHISRFCRLGRASGIHVVLCTQRPDADAVPGQLKANIPATVAFRVRGETNSRILLGEGNEAAAVLPPWPGRGIWQWDTQTQFQAPWLSPEQADQLLNTVRQPALVAGAGSVPPRTTAPYPYRRPRGAGLMRVLSTGIDTLHLAAKGQVRSEVWGVVNEAQEQARLEEESQPVEFPMTGQAFLIKPHGLRGHAYWLTSPDFELILGRSEKFPPVLVQLHSAYMHSIGIERALDLIEALLRHEIFAGAYRLNVSRIDVYADFQGWEPQVTDLDRFVSFSRHRRGFQENQQVYMMGPRLTGFMFGKGDLAARIYDKTVEIRRRGVSWLPDLWGTDGSDQPVWRLEFEYRRAVLAEFNLSDVDEVVASIQDLWRYGTEEWMSLRVPTNHSVRRRWPVDPVWQEIRAIRIAPAMTGVVRRRLEDANELKLLQGLQGYATSLAARRDREQLSEAMDDFGTLVSRYLSSRGRDFTGEVRRKQARQLGVTAFLDEEERGDSHVAGGGGGRCDMNTIKCSRSC